MQLTVTLITDHRAHLAGKVDLHLSKNFAATLYKFSSKQILLIADVHNPNYDALCDDN